ncbi:MAG: saccharopine dehydrogenase C-terminal domain-containing protein [Candidatus Thorarchaeota archaeon]|jgi:saccharopine dehydrogenase-like NADP-dependent oxidoreductase
MEALVVGAGGKMGLAIAYAMAKLNFDVLMYDVYPIDPDKNPNPDKCTIIVDLSEATQVDVVISAAPFASNYEISGWSLLREIPYCDLGGNAKVSKDIQECTKDTPVFTDLGLAPGWANIITQHKVSSHPRNWKITEVKTMVGGLPEIPRWNEQFEHLSLNWDKCFSTKGLRNEYQGLCDIVKDGKPDTVMALEGLEEVNTPGWRFEAFNTSGGSGSTVQFMIDHGIENYCYKTLRYKGHHNVVSFMLNDCKMSDEDFEKYIEQAAIDPVDNIVAIYIELKRSDGTVDVYYKEIKDDEQWTAMQKTTGFPAAAVAALMAEGCFDGQGALGYDDIPYDPFQKRLKLIDPSL